MLLTVAGHIAWINGNLEQSRQYFNWGFTLGRDLGDERTQAWAGMYLAGNTDQQESFLTNWQLCEQSLAIFQKLGDKPGQVQVLNLQGELARVE